MDLYNDISFRTSKIITQAYSTSFSIATSLLPHEMRNSIYSIYGFVRLADEIVDTFHDVNQNLLLTNFERDLNEAIENGISMNPVLHSFSFTAKKYNIPPDLIDSFLKSMKADLKKSDYQTSAELEEYIYGSADVVGLMCLMVFVNGDKNLFNELKKPAMKLGSAFQKVNFLRDLRYDLEELDRSYFPHLRKESFNEEFKLELIKNIERDFEQAKEGIIRLPGKSKLAVAIAYVYYRHLLKKLIRIPAKEIMQKRVHVAGYLKVLLFGKAFLTYRFNLI